MKILETRFGKPSSKAIGNWLAKEEGWWVGSARKGKRDVPICKSRHEADALPCKRDDSGERRPHAVRGDAKFLRQ